MVQEDRSPAETSNQPIQPLMDRAAPGARQLVAPRRGSVASRERVGSFRNAIALGSQLRMAEYRVIAVEVEEGSSRPADPHVVTLCLEDGRRIPRLRAISNLRYGVEAYFTERVGQRARLRVVEPCSRCGEAYLRADEGATLPDSLMSLPPCPPRAAEPAKPRR
jgi:hypothetical protein